MTKLVTNTKFSLHKAKAVKCWRKVDEESGQGSGQVKFNFGECKLISNLASSIQVSHLVTEEAELARFGVGVGEFKEHEMSQTALWRGKLTVL